MVSQRRNKAVQDPHSRPLKACSQGVANPEWSFVASSRQCAAFPTSYRAGSACTVPRGGLLACTPGLPWIPTFGQRLDVVHQAVKAPLRVNFRSAAPREAVQALVVPDVVKRQLRRANVLAIKLPVFGRIDRVAHVLAGMGGILPAGLGTGRVNRRRIRMCYWKRWRWARTKIKNLLALGVSLKSAIQYCVSSKS